MAIGVYFVARKKHVTKNRQDFIRSVTDSNLGKIYQMQETQPAFSLFPQRYINVSTSLLRKQEQILCPQDMNDLFTIVYHLLNSRN